MLAFWNELRRRHVIKVAIAYAVIAWILIQIVTVILPTFQAPPWVTQTITFLLILGFPLAVGLAWAFDISPDGLRRTAAPEAAATARAGGPDGDLTSPGHGAPADPPASAAFSAPGTGTPGAAAASSTAAASTAPAAAASTAVAAALEQPSRSAPRNSIAVLPFTNISPRQEDAYFAVGLHEEILNQLTKIRALSVISRTSVQRFAGSDQPIPAIARELNVGTIMEGSVRYGGDRIRITLQLIDAETDRHLWSETYDREFTDVFAVESDVALKVAGSMDAAFSTSERESIERAATTSPEAYALYLQARALWMVRSDDPLILRRLDRAIALDPRFALALAFRAWLEGQRLSNSMAGAAVTEAERAEQQRLATEHAELALSIDPKIQYASAALGDLKFFGWHWAEAEAAYGHGIEVAPHDAFARGYLGLIKAMRGQTDEAIDLQRKSIELNPGEWGGRLIMAWHLGYAKRFDAAKRELEQALEFAPTYPLTHLWLAYIKTASRDYAGAERSLAAAEELMGAHRPAVALPELIYAYSLIGDTEAVARLGAEVDALGEDAERILGLGGMTMVHLAHGEHDEAISMLERLARKAAVHELDAGFINLVNMKLNFMEDAVLEEPRFREALDRIRGE